MSRLIQCLLTLIFFIPHTNATNIEGSSKNSNQFDDKIAKPTLTIGTIGHLSSGKTTLTSALTYVLSKMYLSDFYSFEILDCSPEEKEYGITIEIDAIEYETLNRHYKHIDCPGHPDYMDNTTKAISQMDGAIVVVSATEGSAAQIYEYIRIARQHKVPALVVFINKCEMVDEPYIIEKLENSIRATISECGYDGYNTPVIKGSALGALIGLPEWEENIMELLDALDSWIPLP